MPIYEYRCEACGEQFDVMQKFSDQPLTIHDACGGHVHRLLSAPAFQFKGSGWYVNDYAKASKPNSGGGSGKTESPAKSDSGSGGKSSDSGTAGSTTTTSAPATDSK